MAYLLAYLIKLILIIFIGLLYCLICALLFFYLVFMSKKQNFKLKDWTDINKHNYKAYGIQSNKDFLKFKRRLKQDLENNVLTFSKYFKPATSSIHSTLGCSIQGSKSNKYWKYIQS